MSTYARVCLIVSDELNLLDKPLAETTTLGELGADSLDALNIVDSIEDEFGIEISKVEGQAEFTAYVTLGEITRFVRRKLDGGKI